MPSGRAGRRDLRESNVPRLGLTVSHLADQSRHQSTPVLGTLHEEVPRIRVVEPEEGRGATDWPPASVRSRPAAWWSTWPHRLRVSGSGSTNPEPSSGFHLARKAPRRPRAMFLKVWLVLARAATEMPAVLRRWFCQTRRSRRAGPRRCAARHRRRCRDQAQRRPLLCVGDKAGNVAVNI